MVFMMSSPILYASDFPQRYWPGKFDIVGRFVTEDLFVEIAFSLG